jgi:methylase of polypeptide subunit release factors
MKFRRDRNYLLKQASSTPSERFQLRSDSNIAKKIFGINFSNKDFTDYYFWDNTTVSFKYPLMKYLPKTGNILEIGTGPFATLSRFIESRNTDLNITATELNKDFYLSSCEVLTNNDSSIKVLNLNMFDGINEKFDLIFFNPPYAKSGDLEKIGIRPGTAEYMAGNGGENGTSVVIDFLTKVPKFIKPNGKILLGINNKYLNDSEIEFLFKNIPQLKLQSKFYGKHDNPPFSQIYSFTIR